VWIYQLRQFAQTINLFMGAMKLSTAVPCCHIRIFCGGCLQVAHVWIYQLWQFAQTINLFMGARKLKVSSPQLVCSTPWLSFYTWKATLLHQPLYCILILILSIRISDDLIYVLLQTEHCRKTFYLVLRSHLCSDPDATSCY
jgi:hypothetical protein